MEIMNKEDFNPWAKRFERERMGRKEAENLLETKAYELFQANENLRNSNRELEEKLDECIKNSPWQKRFERERKVRKEAENLLEDKALELFQANQKLREFNESLEEKIETRTKELEKLNEVLEHRVDEEIKKRHQQEQFLIQQSKMIAMGEMVGSIAHQWRQPLNVVSLLINDIMEAYEYGDLDMKYMENIRTDMMDNIKFMSETIDDFRNFFRTSKQQEDFNAKEVVTDVIRLYFHQSKNHNLTISIIDNDLKVNELVAKGFKNEFKQVILNLITNAKDILVEREIVEKNIKISFQLQNEYLSISVHDNGGGVPEEIINKIFEPYFTTKHEGKGTGIGLYMSKTIIETNMNGKISVENSDGGAKFVILLRR
jgi:signal transduction histidine kinase